MLAPDPDPPPRLIAVTANAADCDAVMAWVERQTGELVLRPCAGFYAAMAAVDRGDPVVVTSVAPGVDGWRLAELRARAGAGAVVVVLADATLLPMLAGALRADVAVTEVAALPPLREVVVGPAPLPRGQTMRRRSNR
jgi:hypothetical protein